MKSESVSGTLWINCGRLACKKVIERSRLMEGVVSAFQVQKRSPNDPDVIVNISGVTEDKIYQAKTAFETIHGVTSSAPQIGKSLMY